jgi:hypothetical protein
LSITVTKKLVVALVVYSKTYCVCNAVKNLLLQLNGEHPKFLYNSPY